VDRDRFLFYATEKENLKYRQVGVESIFSVSVLCNYAKNLYFQSEQSALLKAVDCV
jgi:hypothetical protein